MMFAMMSKVPKLFYNLRFTLATRTHASSRPPLRPPCLLDQAGEAS